MKKAFVFAALLVWSGCVAPSPDASLKVSDAVSHPAVIASAKAEYRAGNYGKAAAAAKSVFAADPRQSDPSAQTVPSGASGSPAKPDGAGQSDHVGRCGRLCPIGGRHDICPALT